MRNLCHPRRRSGIHVMFLDSGSLPGMTKGNAQNICIKNGFLKKFTVKKLIIFCTLFLTITSILPTSSIAFVHLGPELPTYLGHALFQARLFNTTQNIYLLAEQKALAQANAQELVRSLQCSLKIQIVPIETLPCSPEHKLFEQTSTHGTAFRKGFWKFTVERFFVLDDFMQHYAITDLIHLENDTLLYRNVDELLPIFRKYYQGIAAVFINDTHCIPSLVYIRDAIAIKKLTSCLAHQAYTGKNDMILLAEFGTRYGAHYIDSLPIISRSYINRHGLKNAKNEHADIPGKYCNHCKAFNSLFDGNALGQYLGGIDPRIGPPKPRTYINPESFFNPALLTFEWKKDAYGRKIPFIIFEGESYRINNLHIHSKNLQAFLSVDFIS